MSTISLPFAIVWPERSSAPRSSEPTHRATFPVAPAAATDDTGAAKRDAVTRSGADAEERERVRAAKSGDPDAFRRLVDRYRNDVLELAMRIVRSREEAEEVAQDAFVRAWRALPGFREDARFSTWLYRIAARRALDAAATMSRRRSREDVVEPQLVDARVSDASAGPSGLDRAQRQRLWRILGDLEPMPRATVSLFYLCDHSVEETARILEIPEGTVKTHLHRSRAALRRAWLRESSREERLGLPRV